MRRGAWSTPAKGSCLCLKLRCVRARRLLSPLALAAAFGLARGPLHAATFRLPVSNDDAILLLMGRHVLKGELATTLWNQPYNGALDAYLLAPLLAVLPHHDAYRLYQLLCAALLVVLVGLLARRLGGPAAGWAAALLAAWGTPYMALMTATGPPPNFLMPLVTGFPLVAALACAAAADPPGVAVRRAPGPGPRSASASLCGLAVWNSSLAIPAFAGMAAGLALAGLRPRPARAAWFAAGAALGAAPLAVARLDRRVRARRSRPASSAVTAIRPAVDWVRRASTTSGTRSRPRSGCRSRSSWTGKSARVLPLPLVVVLAVGLVRRARRRRAVAARAAAPRLGGRARRRLLALAPHRPRRAALPLRAERAASRSGRRRARRPCGRGAASAAVALGLALLGPVGLGRAPARRDAGATRPTP